MTAKIKILIALALLVIPSLAAVSCGVSVHNSCVQQEAGLKAQYSQNQNNYSQYFNKLKETAQVPVMYSRDLQRIYDSAMKSRYGADGSQAMLQFIQEHNPQIDSGIYRQIQQVISYGRDSFEADQKALLDKKRVYEITLGQFPNGSIARWIGFPKQDPAHYGIVTNAETDQAFSTAKVGPIKLGP